MRVVIALDIATATAPSGVSVWIDRQLYCFGFIDKLPKKRKQPQTYGLYLKHPKDAAHKVSERPTWDACWVALRERVAALGYSFEDVGVVYESAHFTGNVTPYGALREAHGVVLALLGFERGNPRVVAVGPSEWRRTAAKMLGATWGEGRTAKKEEAVRIVQAKYSATVEHDTAEAILIGVHHHHADECRAADRGGRRGRGHPVGGGDAPAGADVLGVGEPGVVPSAPDKKRKGRAHRA